MSMANVVTVNRDIRVPLGATDLRSDLGKTNHEISLGSYGYQLVVAQQVSQVALDDNLITRPRCQLGLKTIFKLP